MNDCGVKVGMTTLVEVAARMDGQDRRATKCPIYVVRERERIYGVEDGYADGVEWIVDDEVRVQSDEELDAVLDDMGLTLVEAEEAGRVRGTGYVDRWRWVQPFLSHDGAKRYVDRNRHNLCDPHVYVATGARNDEWQAMRDALVSEDDEVDRELPGHVVVDLVSQDRLRRVREELLSIDAETFVGSAPVLRALAILAEEG